MKQLGIIALSVILILTLSFCGKKETPQEKAQKEAAKAVEQMAKTYGLQPGQPGRSGSSGQTATPGGAVNPFADMEKATQQIKQQSETQQGGKITVADRDTLMAALPEVSGWSRSEPRYAKNTFSNIEVSDIEAKYTGGGEQPVDIKIQDAGTMSSLLAPYKMVMQMNITREDENGYEKVGSLGGMPVIEKWEKQSGRAEITFIVKDRYIVNLDTEAKGGAKLLQQFAAAMDLAKLQ